MVKHSHLVHFRRAVSLFLVFVLCFSFCPIVAYGQQDYTTISFCVDSVCHDVDIQVIDGVLYCRADQWAQAAGCLWKLNSEQKKLYFYYDTPVILTGYSQGEYIIDNGTPWAPFFDVANQTGIYFSDVVDGKVYGHQAKPLAVFYEDMDRMFAISRYRITELILSLGGFWTVASTASRGYAILSSMSISGFVDAVSGKMDQDVYSAAFIEMLKTDDSLLGVVTDVGEDVTRIGKVVNFLQKALDEGSAFMELLEKLGFSESDINDVIWHLSQVVYGNKTLNDLSDLYEFNKLTILLGILKIIDDIVVSVEADAHTVMAMQEVFADSDSSQIRHAVQKAIGARMGNEALAIGTYTLEYVGDYLVEKAIKEFEEVCEKSLDVGSLEKLVAEGLVWVYDKSLSLTEKSNAVIYSEVYSLLQLELAGYYYEHNNDGAPENGMLMHSVALLYLRSCLAAYKLYEFDNSLAESIGNAKETLEAEISNLMTYTEEELLQNGTSEDCKHAIVDLIGTNNTTPSEPVIPSETPGSREENLIGTYWMLQVGWGVGSYYELLFDDDGTYSAYNFGGDHIVGTYSFDENSGYLYIDDVAYELNGDGYVSVESYFMSGGPSDSHYTLTPSSSERYAEYRDKDTSYTTSPPSSDVPESSLWDGEYTVRLSKDSFYTDCGYICAEAEWMLPMSFDEEFVYSLEPGDIIDLSDFGFDEIIVTDVSRDERTVVIMDDTNPFGYYFWYNAETGFCELNQNAGSGYWPYIASIEMLVFSEYVRIHEETFATEHYLSDPRDADFESAGGKRFANIVIDSGLVTEIDYVDIWY